MNLPDPDLADSITEFAKLQFTPDEIATIVQCPLADLRSIYQPSLDRGRLLAEAEVRKSVYQLAKQGSTPAQKEFMKLNAQAKRANRKTR